MNTTIIRRGDAAYPAELNQLSKQPPVLYSQGRELSDIMQRPRVAIVGSRNITPYGTYVTKLFAKSLAEQGIVIISGLAIGVDAVAHQAALDAGGITMAVLPTPVEHPGPPSNQYLARNILKHGGTLLSTYPAGHTSYKHNFVERNEYVAALSQIVLITEAAIPSGTLQTSKFAADLSCITMAVPGNINSSTSAGANSLIKTGADLALSPQDVISELGLNVQLSLPALRGDTPAEQQLLDLLTQQISDGSVLLERSGQGISEFNHTLTSLEISGKIRALGGNHWALA